MNKIVIILVVLSALMHALRNFFTKKAYDKQAFVWWYEVFGLLFFTPVFAFVLFTERFEFSISFYLVLISGVAHFIYWFFLAKSLESGELSLVYPIMRSSPALVLVFSITILGEKVSLLGGVGIMLVAFGVYTINMEKFSLSEFYKPIIAVRSDRATQFALMTLFSVAAYTIIDKIAVEQMNAVMFAYLYPWFSMLFYTAYLHKIKHKGELRKEWAVDKKIILACGFLSIFGYFLILIAFTIERVSYIVGLRQLSIVFAVLLGGQILKEKNKMIRFSSGLIIFFGAFLIAVAK
ncbi:MAG: EamA family transporter [Deltaproteobacteria bacterium]|nr:EamA family transporter [Deltaproteobacteria bacterium]